MTRQMTATQLKATILAVLDDVAKGETIEISKRGRPVARLVPVSGPLALHNRFAGVAISVSEDDDLFGTGEVWDAQ